MALKSSKQGWRTGQDEEATALYATLLGLKGTQRYGPMEMTPQMLRERTLEVLAEHTCFDMADQRPCCWWWKTPSGSTRPRSR